MNILGFISLWSFFGVFFSINAAFAAGPTEVTYYWGSAKAGLSTAQACAVKINEADAADVHLEALVYMAHEGKYIYTEELELIFDTTRQAYVFNSSEVMPTIKQAALFLDAQTSEPLRFAVSVLHHNHYDPAFCENLVEAQGDEIILAEEFFNNFGATSDPNSDDDVDTDADHDHDHN
ncbi:MAG: hypothetical protein M9899_06335 [Bdellovibrionaceae bacterium]|nr:hypothetical protein [Pseudobdellovibrionaceae bacterium]